MTSIITQPVGQSFRLAFLMFLLLLGLSVGSAVAATYYVAPSGSDANNNGLTVEAPFQTIQKASDVAVAGDVVLVRAGVYREMVDLKANGVIYQPYNGETVTINGTELMLNWSLTSGSTYQTTMDWDVDPTFGTNQVFSDKKMLELARWPNNTSTDIIMPSNASADDVAASGGTTFTITDADFNEPAGRWVGAKIWINLSRGGWDGMGWTGTVVSTSGNTITVDFRATPRILNGPWGLGPGLEYYLFNPTSDGVAASGGVDALLSNGEWWKSGNTLYVKTPTGAAPNATGSGTNVIEAKKRHFAFWASTTRSGYTLKDFHLFACAVITDKDAKTNRTTPEAANNIMIDGLKVDYMSHQTVMEGNWQDEHYNWTGMVVSGRNNTIQNCVIRYSATSALSIQGVNIKVLNNQIEATNYMCSNSGALNTGFFTRDSEIGHNKIFNTTCMGINFRYSKNSNPATPDQFRIHHNEMYDNLRRTGDSGFIDMVGADLQWIRIDHNLLYNTREDARIGFLKHGIYLDYGPNEGGFIRATVDHNVVYNLNNPMLINPGTDINVFNNVFLSHGIAVAPQFAKGLIINVNNATPRNTRVYNNIMSDVPVVNECCGPNSIDFRNNIFNATGAVLNELFVDAANGNYQLKPTAMEAIDKGISIAPYNDNVQGLPDLGAFEWGTFMNGPDTTSPSVPTGFTLTNVTRTGFTVNWPAATDNVGVVSYDVYSNGVFLGNAVANSRTLTGLSPATTYQISVVALDGSGNRSAASKVFEARTLLNDAFIDFAVTAPFLDGNKETAWTGSVQPIARFLSTGPVPAANDLSGSWTALYDNTNLYIYVDVTDNITVVNSGGDWRMDDRIEIMLDPQSKKGVVYTAGQFQYFVRPGSNVVGESKQNALVNVEAATVSTATGYQVEIKIPFATMGTTAAAFKVMGMDVVIGDDDGNNVIKKMAWNTQEDRVHQNPSLMGTVQLRNQGPADLTPPTASTNLRASGITTNAFTLTWTASTDEVGVSLYEVYRNGVLVAMVPSNTITLTSLNPATTYTMAVKAKDQSGNVSASSNIVTVTTYTPGSETKYEAENAVRAGGVRVDNTFANFSGTGYVTGFSGMGTSLTFTVTVPTFGSYDVSLAYSGTLRPIGLLSVFVNGDKKVQTNLPATVNTSTWALKYEPLVLNAGQNTIMYRYDAGDNGFVNLDYIMLYEAGASDPTGIRDFLGSNKPALKVYPNPVTDGWLNLELEKNTGGKPATVYISDLAGRLLQEHTLTGVGPHRLAVNKLPNGVYVVTTRTTTGIWVNRIVIYK